MSTKDIICVPHKILTTPCEKVSDPSSAEIRRLIRDMKDTVTVANGMGLAAPQIGVSLCVIVINYGSETYGLINPEIIQKSKETSVLEEGCLSIPGVFVPVTRPRKIYLRALDEQGLPIELEKDNLLAKILQHEIDHTNGILITDYQTK